MKRLFPHPLEEGEGKIPDTIMAKRTLTPDPLPQAGEGEDARFSKPSPAETLDSKVRSRTVFVPARRCTEHLLPAIQATENRLGAGRLPCISHFANLRCAQNG
jgi:hypothetical protein